MHDLNTKTVFGNVPVDRFFLTEFTTESGTELFVSEIQKQNQGHRHRLIDKARGKLPRF